MNNQLTDRTRANNPKSTTAKSGALWTCMLILTCLIGLSGCGNKGELYIPQESTTENESENTEQSIE